jgi:CRISPR-associated protein Csx17
MDFVCDEFEPTPLLSPWNGGSGFYPKDTKAGIDGIATSKAPRFARYREAIARVRSQIGSIEERPEDKRKAALLAECQREWSEHALEWFSAAVSLSRDGAGRYPALLGTGGNDGRLDFTNNFMQRLVEAIDMVSGRAEPAARETAALALFGGPRRGLQRAVIGQFLPGGAGGANGSAGFDADGLINGWDYVLMLEGIPLLRVAALRRLNGSELPQAAAPFAIRGLPSGYPSADATDDGGRGEQWLPLWSHPVTLRELSTVFGEARMVRGRARTEGAIDAARAIAELGIARGIEGFVRFAFMERNGQANLAVPLSRVRARERPTSGIRLLDEIDGWLDAFRRAANHGHAPASFGRMLRRIQSVIFDLCTAPTPRALTWALLLEELGCAEDLLVRSGRFTADRHLGPIPLLESKWLEVSDDGTLEFRLARAFASVRAPRRRGVPDELGPVRAHCLPLDSQSHFRRFASSANSLKKDPRVVWTGSDLPADLAAIVHRRAVEARAHGFDALPMEGETFARLDDVRRFIDGETDDLRLARLTRGLMTVKPQPAHGTEIGKPLPLYALFRSTQLDASDGTRRTLPPGVSPRCDLQILRLLESGRIADATRLAVTRLGAMGFRAKLRQASGNGAFALRLAASLAFPIGPRAMRHVLDVVAQPFDLPPLETS